MCFGLQGPISGERRHPRAPRGAYFEHLSNTSSTQVLDCSNTSSCQSNSRPYPGNPVLMLKVSPCRAPPVKKIFCAGRRHLSSARRRRRKIWRAKRWGHFCMEKVECPRTSAVPPPAVLPHVTYRCPTLVHMWPPIERRTYVPSSHASTFHSTAGISQNYDSLTDISQTTSASGGQPPPCSRTPGPGVTPRRFLKVRGPARP